MTRFIDRIAGMPVHSYEVVEEWPRGYFVWMIGRRNFPHPGYLPLAKDAREQGYVDTDKLKAICVVDEGLCEYIAREGHYIHGNVTESVFKKMKQDYEQKARHDDR